MYPTHCTCEVYCIMYCVVNCIEYCVFYCIVYRVRNYRGRVTNFDQSEARKQCFLASDWLKFETLPDNFVLSYVVYCIVYCIVYYIVYHIVFFVHTHTALGTDNQIKMCSSKKLEAHSSSKTSKNEELLTEK